EGDGEDQPALGLRLEVLVDEVEVGAGLDLPQHGQVCFLRATDDDGHVYSSGSGMVGRPHTSGSTWAMCSGSRMGIPPRQVVFGPRGSGLLVLSGCRRSATAHQEPPPAVRDRGAVQRPEGSHMDADTKKKIIEEYATTPGDTGSPDVQIA